MADPFTVPNPQDDCLSEVGLIDTDDLSSECEHVAARLHYWLTAHADAVREASDAKTESRTVEAKVLLEIANNRWHVYNEGMTKVRPTEKILEAATRADERVVKAARSLNEAVHKRDKLGAVVESMKTKAVMLQSLGADRRAEMKHLEVSV